ncbi:MAG: ribosome silencing factor [Spirochaetia bacterium]|nr:ribosome silencing factor [Spirochaetia bacterium]
MAVSVDEEIVKKIASFIREHNGQNTIVLDISELNSWTDYFIVSTVTSSGHLRGLLNQLYDFIWKSGLDTQCRHKKTEDEKWILLDCGNVIIHLMSEEAREFYNLEKLWFNGKPVSF